MLRAHAQRWTVLSFALLLVYACDRGQRDEVDPTAESPTTVSEGLTATNAGPAAPRPSRAATDAANSQSDAATPAKNHCERSGACARSGNCVAGLSGRCLPSVEGCAASEICAERGHCAPTETFGCQPESDEHCERSSQCTELGRCVLGAEGACLTSDEACAASRDCWERGACAATDDRRRCEPTTDRHCRQSSGCEALGRCRVDELVEWTNLCEASCEYEALKDIEPQRLTYCTRRAGQAPCRQLEVCSKLGFCEERNGRCALSSEGDCRGSAECRTEGRCNSDDSGESCEAFLSEDCRASAGCKEHGRCSAFDGKCITDEEVEAQCGPRKVMEDGTCHHAVGYDCEKECAESNRCRPKVFDGRFVVCIETAEYCRNHVDCRQKGLCGVNERRSVSFNKCHSSSDSPLACSYTVYGGCVKTVDDCRKSAECKKYGRCSAHTPSSFCRPTRTEHCRQSEICKTEGQCKLLDESSYYICGD